MFLNKPKLSYAILNTLKILSLYHTLLPRYRNDLNIFNGFKHVYFKYVAWIMQMFYRLSYILQRIRSNGIANLKRD